MKKERKRFSSCTIVNREGKFFWNMDSYCAGKAKDLKDCKYSCLSCQVKRVVITELMLCLGPSLYASIPSLASVLFLNLCKVL